MELPESVKIILGIVLVICGFWFACYILDSYKQQRDEERFKIFQEAREQCYARERSCDAIFDNLYEELFPEPADSNY